MLRLVSLFSLLLNSYLTWCLMNKCRVYIKCRVQRKKNTGFLTDSHFANSISNTYDVITFCNIYSVFAGGLF
ncbi:hypothetical protein M2459_000701 [Parabacteroides sp. PF5-5]|nr:hypothetical protein [Parabacteroides sp. PH5-39]MDH6314688.1 hypothetical protein [Parabacteroides sp. PF5-13]MDH6318025.1 hypothetical protein [Parabacteroides sp. PH5-13]MDH6322044.1 hypothetical protein [Parabacteroides sp. PH5-8]MDH6326167.1 hypothetical protein [Parabacteroides sp. PH5-41]MDH6333967.1 hypothetical protein [Parabacteroides sp. PF5-5]MDH6345032.1 hypothetical protein [Parabacteroides sp. PH5-46]MDH6359698.1 hypothetical protein [Parabacteroides sp. PH5-16]MDH6375365.